MNLGHLSELLTGVIHIPNCKFEMFWNNMDSYNKINVAVELYA